MTPAFDHAQAEQIEELKRSTQFPKLTPTSPEFLTLMEEYVREVRTWLGPSNGVVSAHGPEC